ncbi:MAG: helix-turn-helix transcriptional regulator [Clostridia bacterium]|nr:helix-turn-helix transcriptional regulator [Clostridia bacterium]
MTGTAYPKLAANDVHYVSAKVIDINEKWILAGKKCENYTLFAVERGEMRVSSSSGAITVSASQALFLTPDTRIRSAHSGETGVRFFFAELSLERAHPLSPGLNTVSGFGFEILSRLTRTSAENEKVLADALVFSLLCEMKKAPATGQEREHAIVLHELECNGFAEIDIDGLAKTTGVSKAKLLKAFTELTGRTPKAYANEKRVEYSRTLLAHSAFTVSKIAELVGFDDANLFTKFFTYHMGVTPSDYRRVLNSIPARSKRG